MKYKIYGKKTQMNCLLSKVNILSADNSVLTDAKLSAQSVDAIHTEPTLQGPLLLKSINFNFSMDK